MSSTPIELHARQVIAVLLSAVGAVGGTALIRRRQILRGLELGHGAETRVTLVPDLEVTRVSHTAGRGGPSTQA